MRIKWNDKYHCHLACEPQGPALGAALCSPSPIATSCRGRRWRTSLSLVSQAEGSSCPSSPLTRALSGPGWVEAPTRPARAPQGFPVVMESSGEGLTLSPPGRDGLGGEVAQPWSPALAGGTVPGSLVNVLTLASKSGPGAWPTARFSILGMLFPSGDWEPINNFCVLPRETCPLATKTWRGGPWASAPTALCLSRGLCSDPLLSGLWPCCSSCPGPVSLLEERGQGRAHGAPWLHPQRHAGTSRRWAGAPPREEGRGEARGRRSRWRRALALHCWFARRQAPG